jgi:phosphoenolpyruvate-protein kinase (PTS system EI component)
VSTTVRGIAAAPGVALATAWQRVGEVDPSSAELAADEPAVRAAFAAVARRLADLASQLRAKGLAAESDILDAEALIAGDGELVGAVVEAMEGGSPAGRAVVAVGEQFAALLEQLDTAHLRERAADVRQVVRRVLAVLAADADADAPPGTFVLFGAEVGPLDLLELATAGLAGAVSLRGGVNAHAAIVARSLGLPLILGVDPRRLELRAGSPVLVDGDRGVLVIDPPPEARVDATRRMLAATTTQRRYAVERGLPCETADGIQVALLCNIASTAEARSGMAAGAAGVGLLRTELPFLQATDWPTESAHRERLRPILALLEGRPVTVRLLDFSNDKVPPFLSHRPAGLEALLARRDALRSQLAAVLDAGRGVDLRIMLAMVRSAAPVAQVRCELERVAHDIGVEPPKLGVMIELPEAVEHAGELAGTADFFSLGTNDLTAAVLGCERSEPRLHPSLAAHPRVLALITRAAAAAARAGIPVSACGDAAAEPVVLPLLLGAGVRALSVAPARVDEVRWRVRRTCAGEWARRLDELMALEDAKAVRSSVEHQLACEFAPAPNTADAELGVPGTVSGTTSGKRAR